MARRPSTNSACTSSRCSRRTPRCSRPPWAPRRRSWSRRSWRFHPRGISKMTKVPRPSRRKPSNHQTPRCRWPPLASRRQQADRRPWPRHAGRRRGRQQAGRRPCCSHPQSSRRPQADRRPWPRHAGRRRGRQHADRRPCCSHPRSSRRPLEASTSGFGLAAPCNRMPVGLSAPPRRAPSASRPRRVGSVHAAGRRRSCGSWAASRCSNAP
mmetsp:Transcript_8459/g.24318  ORF Transcript_8459/g.24318 Transcript_8459/m.24318 type:complete len:211 (-) Transcript_8459:393-1025(-)